MRHFLCIEWRPYREVIDFRLILRVCGNFIESLIDRQIEHGDQETQRSS